MATGPSPFEATRALAGATSALSTRKAPVVTVPRWTRPCAVAGEVGLVEGHGRGRSRRRGSEGRREQSEQPASGDDGEPPAPSGCRPVGHRHSLLRVASAAEVLSRRAPRADRWLAVLLSGAVGHLGRALFILSVAPAAVAVLILVAYPETAGVELEQLNPEEDDVNLSCTATALLRGRAGHPAAYPVGSDEAEKAQPTQPDIDGVGSTGPGQSARATRDHGRGGEDEVAR